MFACHELYPGQRADFVSEATRAFAWLEERDVELRKVAPTFLEWQSDESSVLVSLRARRDDAYHAVQMALGPADEPDVERYLSMYRLEELRPPPEDAPTTGAPAPGGQLAQVTAAAEPAWRPCHSPSTTPHGAGRSVGYLLAQD